MFDVCLDDIRQHPFDVVESAALDRAVLENALDARLETLAPLFHIGQNGQLAVQRASHLLALRQMPAVRYHGGIDLLHTLASGFQAVFQLTKHFFNVVQTGIVLSFLCQQVLQLRPGRSRSAGQTVLLRGQIIPIDRDALDLIMKLCGPSDDVDDTGFLIFKLGLQRGTFSVDLLDFRLNLFDLVRFIFEYLFTPSRLAPRLGGVFLESASLFPELLDCLGGRLPALLQLRDPRPQEINALKPLLDLALDGDEVVSSGAELVLGLNDFLAQLTEQRILF